MSRRFLKKIRNFRLMSGLLIASLTILSFQNCAPAPQACSDGSKNCTSEGSKSSSSTSNNGNSSLWSSGSGSSSGFAGGGGGSVSTGGSNASTGGGGGISVGGGGGNTGGSTGGSTGGGSTGSGTGSTGSDLLRISTPPASVNVQEGQGFELSVQTAGGKSPLKYQWFKDGVAMDHVLGQYQFISDNADSYKKAGFYAVEVTDATGRTVRSERAAVNIVEPQVGCAAGSYFTFTNATYDVLEPKYFTEYFDGPRGKFLLHQSYDTYNLYSLAKYAGVSTFNVSANIGYGGTTFISCRTAIPRIHTPQPNPSAADSGSYNQYADGNGYTYTGKVNFECRNKKLLLKQNTCKWTYTPPPRGSSR